jgi:ribonuclease BN (tRNA processing enzyme)
MGRPMSLHITFVGIGDASGSGDQFQTHLLIDASGIRFAVDFDATSLFAHNKLRIEHDTIDAIILPHLRSDHCGGIPFLLTDALLGAKRVILTHMSREMLPHANSVPEECAHDRMVVKI